jgi:hypothetical protein
MNINKEIDAALSLIQIAIEEDKSPWLQMNMNWSWDTNLGDIIEFNDQLRGCGYKTTYEIYGDKDRIPHVVATFTKLQEE